jgi:hypothetical protein
MPAMGRSARDELLSQAEETERLARMVSYGPDKRALLEQAERLRERARQIDREARTWSKPSGPRPTDH